MPVLTRSAPRLLAALTVAGALLAAAMTLPAAAQERPRVVAVNHALASLAARLGGDAVEVVFPVPDGTDPAFWRPAIADIAAIQSADLIVLNGAGYADWPRKASLPRARLVDTSRAFEARFISTGTVTHSHGDGGTHSHTGTASFTWLDPALAGRQAEAIADAMVRRGLLPEATAQARLGEVRDALAGLEAQMQDLRARAEGLPVIATHPRYQYLARATGLEIVSLEWDTGAAPDAAQREELAARRDETGARLLLWEAAPPTEARAAIAGMGLSDMVFPTFATPPEQAPDDFLAGFAAALSELDGLIASLDG
jgi:zinc transport system substrate-binding protein